MKTAAAQAQIDEDRSKARPVVPPVPSSDPPQVQPVGGGAMVPPETPQQPIPPALTPPAQAPASTHFYMSAKLDNMRINRDVHRLVEEIISHLTDLDGCSVDIHLEVSASNPDIFSVPIVRAVSENCRKLKVEEFGFDK